MSGKQLKLSQNKCIVTYPNQKILEIHPVMNTSNTFAGEIAQRTLSWKGYSLYMYCVYRRTNKYWALSKEDVVKNTALTADTYPLAVKELIEKGYLVAKPIKLEGQVITENAYHFYESLTTFVEKSKSNKNTAVITTPAIGRNRVVALDKTEVF